MVYCLWRTYRYRTEVRCRAACTRTTVVWEIGVAGICLARESVRRRGAARAPAPQSMSPVRWWHGRLCLAQRKVWWSHGAQHSPAGTCATFLRTRRNKFKTLADIIYFHALNYVYTMIVERDSCWYRESIRQLIIVLS